MGNAMPTSPQTQMYFGEKGGNQSHPKGGMI